MSVDLNQRYSHSASVFKLLIDKLRAGEPTAVLYNFDSTAFVAPPLLGSQGANGPVQ